MNLISTNAKKTKCKSCVKNLCKNKLCPCVKSGEKCSIESGCKGACSNPPPTSFDQIWESIDPKPLGGNHVPFPPPPPPRPVLLPPPPVSKVFDSTFLNAEVLPPFSRDFVPSEMDLLADAFHSYFTLDFLDIIVLNGGGTSSGQEVMPASDDWRRYIMKGIPRMMEISPHSCKGTAFKAENLSTSMLRRLLKADIILIQEVNREYLDILLRRINEANAGRWELLHAQETNEAGASVSYFGTLWRTKNGRFSVLPVDLSAAIDPNSPTKPAERVTNVLRKRSQALAVQYKNKIFYVLNLHFPLKGSLSLGGSDELCKILDEFLIMCADFCESLKTSLFVVGDFNRNFNTIAKNLRRRSYQPPKGGKEHPPQPKQKDWSVSYGNLEVEATELVDSIHIVKQRLPKHLQGDFVTANLSDHPIMKYEVYLEPDHRTDEQNFVSKTDYSRLLKKMTKFLAYQQVLENDRIENEGERRAQNLGLEITRVVGDGACMFRALSQVLYGAQDAHFDLRCQAIRRIRENAGLYLEYMGDQNNPFAQQEREDYMTQMSLPTAWGDHVMLQALADDLNLEIIVVHDGYHDLPIRIQPRHQIERTIFLLYTNRNHYDALL